MTDGIAAVDVALDYGPRLSSGVEQGVTIMRTLALVAATIVALCAAPGVSIAQAPELPSPLVSVDWLEFNQEDVVLLDVRKNTKLYGEDGHIPGAVLVDWKQVRADVTEDGVVYERMLLDEPRFEQLMQAHGVDNDSTVVIAHGGKDALQLSFGARLYWQLKYYGHDRVAILDGGTAQWKATGRELSKEPSPVQTGTFEVTDRRDALLATTEEVEAALAAQSAQLVDSRPLAFYLGLEQRSYVYAPGHIPGAKHMPFSLLTPGKGPGVLRTPEDLRQAALALGIDPAKPLITYCNSGHVASGVWFLLAEVLGNENAQLYDGSLHAWTKDAARPMVSMRVD